MVEMEESRAPWSRVQKQAVIGLPVMLIVSALMIGKAFLGPYDWSDTARVIIVLVMGTALVAMIVAPMRTDCPDERDRLIVMKAMRRAYTFLMAVLLLPFAMRQAFTETPPTWNAEILAIGLVLLSQAVYFGSILLLYRRGTEG